MNGSRNATLLVFLAAAFAFWTKPTHDSFKRALQKSMRKTIERKGGSSGIKQIDSFIAKGASWFVRQVAGFRYTDYTLLAVEEAADEDGEWQLVAIGVFGLWFIAAEKERGVDVVKAD